MWGAGNRWWVTCSLLPLTSPGELGSDVLAPSIYFGALSLLGLWSCSLEIPHSGATLAHVQGRGCVPLSLKAQGNSGGRLLP